MSQLAATPQPLAPVQPAEPRRGSRPFWSDEELSLLRCYYAELGPAGMAPYLPARTVASITEVARKQGLRFLEGYTRQPPSTAPLDAAIRRLYHNGVLEAGQMRGFVAKWRRPRQWVRSRAIALGVCQPRRAGPWRPEEDALLREAEGRGQRWAQKRLIRAGYKGRTEPAISQRMHYLGLEVRDDTATYTAQGVARLLGMDVHVPLAWIKSGKLSARKRDSRSSADTVAWDIPRRALRQFLIDHPGEWYPGRCDVYWLVDILAHR
jgi:hypothetical protein